MYFKYQASIFSYQTDCCCPVSAVRLTKTLPQLFGEVALKINLESSKYTVNIRLVTVSTKTSEGASFDNQGLEFKL